MEALILAAGLCWILSSATGLSTTSLLQYDWQSKQCNCQISQAGFQFEAHQVKPDDAKELPSRAGIVFIEMPRTQSSGLFAQSHKFSEDSSLLELSPTGNRLKLPVEEDNFKIFDHSLGNLRESSLGMNDTSMMNIDGFSRVQLIHSRVLIGNNGMFSIKEHSVMKANFASLYLADDTQFTADFFSQVDFSYKNDLQFEMPALTMKWGTEIKIKEHSLLVNDGGFMLLEPATYVALKDRSKLSLGRQDLSVRATNSEEAAKPSNLIMMEASTIELTTGSHIHIAKGCTLYVAPSVRLTFDSSAVFVQPNLPGGSMRCVVHKNLKLNGRFIRLDQRTTEAEDREQKGIMCEITAQKLAEKVILSDIYEKMEIQLLILAYDERNPLVDPLHVDPEIPKSYQSSDCPDFS